MQGENGVEPGWLLPLLKANFYSICERHDKRNKNVFCLDCKGLVLCEECVKAKVHLNHRTLQVYKSSRQVSIRADSIYKLIDVSDVQQYKNNDYRVYYIKQRRQQENEQPSNNNNIKTTQQCEICGWQLLSTTSTSKYCSIQCMVNGEGNFRKQSNKIRCERPESFKETSYEQSMEDSRRKRCRKGIPRRSPLL